MNAALTHLVLGLAAFTTGYLIGSMQRRRDEQVDATPGGFA